MSKMANKFFNLTSMPLDINLHSRPEVGSKVETAEFGIIPYNHSMEFQVAILR